MSESAIRGGLALLATVLLLGCAIPHPGQLTKGMTESEVVARMGAPTARYDLGDREARLEFAQGPAGRETWMVDLDASGRTTRTMQVLDPWYFAQITDAMDRDALLRILGRPGWVRGARLQQELWFWRYPNNDCLVAVATLNAQHKVFGGVSMMPDPDCERRR
jgi:hypothetical protein